LETANALSNNMDKDGGQITHEEQVKKDQDQNEDKLPSQEDYLVQDVIIFMARQQHESLNRKDIETSKIDLNSCELKILHYNVQSMNDKLLGIYILLSFDNINVDVVLLNTG
jgi:primase-polymerase (primpol)-like protein